MFVGDALTSKIHDHDLKLFFCKALKEGRPWLSCYRGAKIVGRHSGYTGRLRPCNSCPVLSESSRVSPDSATRPCAGSHPLSVGRPCREEMGRHQRSRSASGGSSTTRSDIGDLDFAAADLDCPFGRVDALGPVELRETAYEIFFMSCRSYGGPAPGGSGARGGVADGEVPSPVAGSVPRGGAGGSVMGSRIKKALGLRARRMSSGTQPMMVRTLSQTSGPVSPGRARRPMTSAEIMRQQMRVTDQSDARLRRTLMRAVVGQVGRFICALSSLIHASSLILIIICLSFHRLAEEQTQSSSRWSSSGS
jgi:hypothetical protein